MSFHMPVCLLLDESEGLDAMGQVSRSILRTAWVSTNLWRCGRPCLWTLAWRSSNGGDCYLRYDDTNPEAEKMEFIEHIQDIVAWLGWKACQGAHQYS